MRIVTIVGTRPQFIKAAPVSEVLRASLSEYLVHTGQHHDAELSGALIDDVGLPTPDVDLGVHGGSAAEQLARCLPLLDSVLTAQRPDAVLVYGDTNATLAGALAADRRGIPLVHVEAGLRSFDERMIEERNRIVTDHLSHLLLCSSDTGASQLRREGITRGVHIVGDVMQDALLAAQRRARGRSGDSLLEHYGVRRGEFVLATIHRAENTDDPQQLAAVLSSIAGLEFPVLLPLHPRARAAVHAHSLTLPQNLTVVPPLNHSDFTTLASAARCIVTDSGGLQKEAYWLAVPCVTLRRSTEWVETVSAGWNRLAEATVSELRKAVSAAVPQAEHPTLFGTPGAATRIVQLLPTLLR
jgi:UDP-GlcNAc3NAcA epimerase